MCLRCSSKGLLFSHLFLTKLVDLVAILIAIDSKLVDSYMGHEPCGLLLERNDLGKVWVLLNIVLHKLGMDLFHHTYS